MARKITPTYYEAMKSLTKNVGIMSKFQSLTIEFNAYHSTGLRLSCLFYNKQPKIHVNDTTITFSHIQSDNALQSSYKKNKTKTSSTLEKNYPRRQEFPAMTVSFDFKWFDLPLQLQLCALFCLKKDLNGGNSKSWFYL